jgi:hypothetical protein
MRGKKGFNESSKNYGLDGPQHLQLLCWEFPEEYWEPLREGCSMIFFILPAGKLKLNSPMMESEKEVAGKFVDELKKLGTL